MSEIQVVEMRCQWNEFDCACKPTHLVYDGYECAGSYCKPHAELIAAKLESESA